MLNERKQIRESWFVVFIRGIDTNDEERSKGKTVEYGASQADIAVLVISSRRGEFETGFEKGGQTRKHDLRAEIAGIKQLIV